MVVWRWIYWRFDISLQDHDPDAPSSRCLESFHALASTLKTIRYRRIIISTYMHCNFHPDVATIISQGCEPEGHKAYPSVFGILNKTKCWTRISYSRYEKLNRCGHHPVSRDRPAIPCQAGQETGHPECLACSRCLGLRTCGKDRKTSY
jgi:hypothetical protein